MDQIELFASSKSNGRKNKIIDWAAVRANSEMQVSRRVPEKYENEAGFSDFYWLVVLL